MKRTLANCVKKAEEILGEEELLDVMSTLVTLLPREKEEVVTSGVNHITRLVGYHCGYSFSDYKKLRQLVKGLVYNPYTVHAIVNPAHRKASGELLLFWAVDDIPGENGQGATRQRYRHAWYSPRGESLPEFIPAPIVEKQSEKKKEEGSVRTWEECKEITFKDKLRSYDSSKDEYTLFLSKLGHVNVPGQKVRDMYHQYSKFGLNLTRQEVAINLDLDKLLVIKMMEALSLQKGSLPITEETLQRTSVDDAVLGLEKNKALQVLKRAEQKRLDSIQKELVNLKDHQQWVKGVFNRVLDNLEALDRPVVEVSPGGTTAFWSMHDEHWGKKPYDDETYTIEDQLEEMSSAADRVIAKLKAKENLEEIVTVFGSDMFHVDSIKKMTTKGTPQDMMTSVQGMSAAVVKHFTMCIHKARTIAPVTIYVIAGNHDYTIVEATSQFLAYIFSDTPNVRVVADNSIRKYHPVGTTMVMLHHSDVRPNNLRSVIDSEISHKFPGRAFPRRITMGGHLHSFKLSMDSYGNDVNTTSTSPSKSDRWTQENYGVKLDRQVTVYYVETDGPLVGVDFVRV